MPSHPTVTSLKAFSGLSNVTPSEGTSQTFLKKVDNFNITKTGDLKKRKGYIKIDSGNYSSLWTSPSGLGCYGMKDGGLVSISLPGPIVTHLKYANLQKPISFEEIDGIIYFASEEVTGRIVNGVVKDWGLAKCKIIPRTTLIAGNLLEGDYQFSLTYVRDDLFESGSGPSILVHALDNSGFSFTLPVTSFATKIRVYISLRNGGVQYYYGEGLPGEVFSVTSEPPLTNPFRLFNLDAPPVGSIIRYYRGRMYVAYKNLLWYSEPFQYEYFRLTSNYIPYPSDILDVLPVEDGIYVASDRLYYLSGKSPESFNQVVKENIKVVPGSSQRVSSAYLHMDNTPAGYKWLITTNEGIVALFNQGLVINMTSKNVSIEPAEESASVFIQDEGNNAYLAMLKVDPSKPNNAGVSDLVESVIIRNGVIIS